MFDDDLVQDIHCSPSPQRPARRQRGAPVVAAAGHARRKRRPAPSLQDRLQPINPISARLPYRGPPHY